MDNKYLITYGDAKYAWFQTEDEIRDFINRHNVKDCEITYVGHAEDITDSFNKNRKELRISITSYDEERHIPSFEDSIREIDEDMVRRYACSVISEAIMTAKDSICNFKIRVEIK